MIVKLLLDGGPKPNEGLLNKKYLDNEWFRKICIVVHFRGELIVLHFSEIHSTLLVNFHLQRHMGNFVIQVTYFARIKTLKIARLTFLPLEICIRTRR